MTGQHSKGGRKRVRSWLVYRPSPECPGPPHPFNTIDNDIGTFFPSRKSAKIVPSFNVKGWWLWSPLRKSGRAIGNLRRNRNHFRPGHSCFLAVPPS